MHFLERRVKLEKGKQRSLFLSAAIKYGSIKNLANKFSIPYSTCKKYGQEVFLFPESLFDRIIAELELDKKSLGFSYLDGNWGAKIGGKKGIAAITKKYPEKIKTWRRNALINSHANRTKKIKVPLINEKLAEFVGAYLGDGSLTPYFIRISGDFRCDLPYFEYLNKLAFDLFGLTGKLYRDKGVNTANLVFFSKQLCSFFNSLGIKTGDKIRNKSIIPKAIFSDKCLSLACLRGLIDTDGSISRRGRKGEQFTIVFANHNPYLLYQVKEISDRYGIFTFFSDKDKVVGTNKYDNIKNYFSAIGSSNLRHIVRFYERFYNNNTIYQREARNYYQKPFYRDINLPFKVAS